MTKEQEKDKKSVPKVAKKEQEEEDLVARSLTIERRGPNLEARTWDARWKINGKEGWTPQTSLGNVKSFDQNVNVINDFCAKTAEISEASLLENDWNLYFLAWIRD